MSTLLNKNTIFNLFNWHTTFFPVFPFKREFCCFRCFFVSFHWIQWCSILFRERSKAIHFFHSFQTWQNIYVCRKHETWLLHRLLGFHAWICGLARIWYWEEDMQVLGKTWLLIGSVVMNYWSHHAGDCGTLTIAFIYYSIICTTTTRTTEPWSAGTVDDCSFARFVSNRSFVRLVVLLPKPQTVHQWSVVGWLGPAHCIATNYGC